MYPFVTLHTCNESIHSATMYTLLQKYVIRVTKVYVALCTLCYTYVITKVYVALCILCYTYVKSKDTVYVATMYTLLHTCNYKSIYSATCILSCYMYVTRRIT